MTSSSKRQLLYIKTALFSYLMQHDYGSKSADTNGKQRRGCDVIVVVVVVVLFIIASPFIFLISTSVLLLKLD
jgi:hypothetical protein